MKEKQYVMNRTVCDNSGKVELPKGSVVLCVFEFVDGYLMLRDKEGAHWIIASDAATLVPTLEFSEPFAGLDWIDELEMDAVAYWCPVCGTIIFTPTENLFYGVEQPQDCPLCETPMWVHPPKGE
jgi:hypothetical protein